MDEMSKARRKKNRIRLINRRHVKRRDRRVERRSVS